MNPKRGVFTRKFCAGMAIYCVCFLIMTAVGLKIWWDFIDCYEASRPKTAVNAYMNRLTAEKVCENSDDLLSSLDSNIQSRETAGAVIVDALQDKFSSAKKSKESTDDLHVYAILSGKQEIGEFSIQAGEPGRFGFRIWSLKDASFDLSYLSGEPVQITVPEEFTVRAGDVILSEEYIVSKDIPYTSLEEFYGKYDLPSMVTYSVDDYLGELTLEVLDASGNQIVIDQDTDYNAFLPSCTAAEEEEFAAFIPEFLDRYVNYSGGAKNSVEVNLKQLKRMLVTDGELAEMFESALRGLRFAASKKDTVQEILVHRVASFEDDTYFCDLTFLVETVGRANDIVHTENNMRLILVREEGDLKVASLVRY